MHRANIKETPVIWLMPRNLPSSTSEGETAHDPQARKGMAIVLIARQTLTRHCLSRSFQNALPDLRVVAVANVTGLLDASRLLRRMDLMVFTISDRSVRDAEVLGQITWLRQHMPGVPLVLLIERDDMDDIVEAMAQGVRGLITTNMELSEIGAAIQCVAAGGTFRAGRYAGQVRPGSAEPIGARPEQGQRRVVQKPHAAGTRGPGTFA
jgi:DNA-binding NarL/FixJ family response regulator